jgi:hypothetical protein
MTSIYAANMSVIAIDIEYAGARKERDVSVIGNCADQLWCLNLTF